MVIDKLTRVALSSLLFLTSFGCKEAAAPQTVAQHSSAPPSHIADSGQSDQEIRFRRKLDCSEAAIKFNFAASSPRGGAYSSMRHCYSATLNTCIVEFAAPDESATIFDILTREPLLEYLNYPGDADQIHSAARLSGMTPPATAPTAPTEHSPTPQHAEYLRWSAFLFEGCAK